MIDRTAHVFISQIEILRQGPDAFRRLYAQGAEYDTARNGVWITKNTPEHTLAILLGYEFTSPHLYDFMVDNPDWHTLNYKIMREFKPEEAQTDAGTKHSNTTTDS